MDSNCPSQLVQSGVWNNFLQIIPRTKHGGGATFTSVKLITSDELSYIKVVSEQCLLQLSPSVHCNVTTEDSAEVSEDKEDSSRTGSRTGCPVPALERGRHRAGRPAFQLQPAVILSECQTSNHRYVETTCLQVQFSVMCCDDAVLMLLIGSAGKTTWLELEKDPVLTQNIIFVSHHKHDQNDS